MHQYLIVCPLVFLAGFVDSIAGGGGLISLPAYLAAGVPPHLALGTNKMGSTMGTVISTARFAKSGYIKWKLSLFAAACAIVGSIIGSNLSLLASEKFLKGMMLFALPVVAFYVLKNKDMGDNKNTGSLTEKQMAEIFQMAEVFRFLIKDMGKDSLLIEAIRTETKNDSILKVFKERYTNIEVVRGGPVAIDCISMQDR